MWFHFDKPPQLLHNQLLQILLCWGQDVRYGPICGTLWQYFRPKLTSVSIESSKGDPLFCWSGAVGDLHLQFVPGRLLQVVQDVALGQRCALGRGPSARLHRTVLQYEGGDWTAAVVPANQVEPDPGGVNAGEEFVFFGKLGLWEEDGKEGKDKTWEKLCTINIVYADEVKSFSETFKVNKLVNIKTE